MAAMKAKKSRKAKKAKQQNMGGRPPTSAALSQIMTDVASGKLRCVRKGLFRHPLGSSYKFGISSGAIKFKTV